MSMLKVDQLHVYYGDSHVIRGVSLELGENETVAIMGRNGMGKTTLLKALMGLLPVRQGTLRVREQALTNSESYQRVAAGMGFIPQGRMIFPYLTVEENLLAGMETLKNRQIPQFVYDVFPVLQEMKNRKGGNLSGGQQQQLAVARALVSKPTVLLLDEPTEGIQPSIIKDIAVALNQLKADLGFSLLLTEQALSFAMEVADRFLIMERGEFVHEENRTDVDEVKIRSYLTI
jgi:urea transport system ATP-binding protein|tara:strand:+ start:47 stop:742 length:696 start_codon:yes stop_codon:yes gene_type:complete